MHLHKKLTIAIAFALILNATPSNAQEAWTPLTSGDWSTIPWLRGSEQGTPGNDDAIRIEGGRAVIDEVSRHSGDVSVLGGGKLDLKPAELDWIRTPLRTGVVTVSGAGSEWMNRGTLRFDKVAGKTQSLTVAAGGKMQTWNTFLGITTGDYATTNVDGVGTQLIQQGRITVGYTGNARLNVTNQATVTSNNTIIGDVTGSNGEVTVTGVSTMPPAETQTLFDSGVILTVGKQGTGNLSVLQGASVTAKSIIIGGQADDGLGAKGSGVVTVAGRGSGIPQPVSSRLSATEGDIKIGDGGTGHLTVKDYGSISASGRIILGSNGGSGSITIGDTAGGEPLAAKRIGTVTATEIHGDGGEAKVNFHLSSFYDTGTVFTTRITGNAEVNIDGWEGGTLFLANNSTYFGGTNIYGAGLIVSNASQVGTGRIFVDGGSLYLGSGVTLSNEIHLAGGSNYSKETEAGEALEMSVQSAETAGVATSAGILAGTQSTASPVTTSFGSTSSASNDDLRISDVFSLSGTGDSIFVLDLKVDDLQSGAFLGWLDTDSGQWVNAINENEGNTDFALSQFLGTYEEFALLNDGDLASHLGAWGVYDSGVWAVLNHNSDFSIVAIPEPSTYALIIAGAFGLHLIRRRRK